MISYVSNFASSIGLSDDLSDFLSVVVAYSSMLCFSLLFYIAIKYYTAKVIKKNVKKKGSHWANLLIKYSFFNKLSYLIPLIIFYSLIGTLRDHRLVVANLIFQFSEKTISSLIIINCNVIITTLLNILSDFYHRKISIARDRPIKSYIQVVKIVLWMFSFILLVSNILGQSPITMLTGLGAMSAILMLTFKDSILGFVSSVQVSAYDIVRIGDWITIKGDNIDGTVIDISLNVVKIKNFDKTVVTIPTQGLIQKGVINWREMELSGGRRIKKFISIDMLCIKFCDEAFINKISSKIPLISRNIENLVKRGGSITNITLLREYAEEYLKSRDDIHNENFSLLIRQLQPTEYGAHVEIYAFTKTIEWKEYEKIQAEIIEHLIAILHLFDLKIFQRSNSSKSSVSLLEK